MRKIAPQSLWGWWALTAAERNVLQIPTGMLPTAAEQRDPPTLV
jgi:hypothetical protein